MIAQLLKPRVERSVQLPESRLGVRQGDSKPVQNLDFGPGYLLSRAMPTYDFSSL